MPSIQSIYTALEAGSPMIQKESVRAIRNKGIEEDRYAAGVAHTQNQTRQR